MSQSVDRLARSNRSISLNIRVSGLCLHGWLDPSENEPGSFVCIILNAYYNTFFYGLHGWTAKDPNIDQAVVDAIGDYLTAWFQ